MRRNALAASAVAAVALTLASPASAAPVAGDFDRDGRDDLAVGLIGQSVGGRDFAGAVHVIYGGRKGLSRRDRVLTQNTNGIRERAEEGDSFGGALAVGDFDGDRFDDLAIGVPFESHSGREFAGALQVLYGSRRGLTAKGDQLIVHGRKGFGPEPSEFDDFGWSLAAGDFGKGRRDDLAVSSIGAVVDGIDFAGMVEVLHGSRRGLRTRGAKRFTQAMPTIGDDPEDQDRFGWMLASGDVGRDGHDDLAIGVPFESISSAGSAGAVQLIYGSNRGLRSKGALFLDQLVLDGGVGGVDVEPEANDNFGTGIAIGDFGRGGKDDLAIAAPDEEVEEPAPNIAGGGMVMVGYGARDGLRTGATGNVQIIYEAAVTNAFNAGTRFGRTLRAANFGRSGKDDLVAALPGADGTIENDAGAVGVLYGSDSGLTTTGSNLIGQDSPGVEGDANTGQEFGRFLAGGRFDGKGPFDLAVGIPNEGFPGTMGAGAVALFRGTAQGITTAKDRLLRQGAGGLGGRLQPSDLFGSGLSGSSSGVFFD